MTIEHSSQIDFIGTCRETGTVVLAIADHLPWGTPEHLLLLQEKLNSYIAFVETGQIFDVYPEAKDIPIRVDLVTKFEPDTTASAFLEEAEAVLNGIKIAFRQETSPQETSDHT